MQGHLDTSLMPVQGPFFSNLQFSGLKKGILTLENKTLRISPRLHTPRAIPSSPGPGAGDRITGQRQGLLPEPSPAGTSAQGSGRDREIGRAHHRSWSGPQAARPQATCSSGLWPGHRVAPHRSKKGWCWGAGGTAPSLPTLALVTGELSQAAALGV